MSSCGDLSTTSGTDTSCLILLTTETSGAEMGVAAAANTLGGDEIAQSFKVPIDKNITQVQLKLLRVGRPNGTLTLKLQGNSGDAPDGTDLTTATLNVTTDDTTGEGNISSTKATFYTFTFGSEVSLVTTRTYWLRLQASYSLSDTHVIKWSGNNSNTYTNGNAIYETSINNSWSSNRIGTNRDLLFKLGCS
jgi:hypothetical protein